MPVKFKFISTKLYFVFTSKYCDRSRYTVCFKDVGQDNLLEGCSVLGFALSQ